MGLTVTTVTLEGFIFGKHYLLLDCMNGKNAHISDTIKKYSEYQKGIDKVEIFKRVKSFEEIFKFVQKKNLKINQKKIDNQINYFYYNQNKNYPSKIAKSVDKILI